MKLYQVLQQAAQAPEALLAFGRTPKDAVSAGDWLARVAAWQGTFAAAPSLERVAVYLEDSAELAAVLVALWYSDREAWLAPNNLSATTQDLTRFVNGFVGDFVGVACCTADRGEPALLAPIALSEESRLCLFTSGSSGEPQIVKKALRQLAAETEQLQACFGTYLLNSCMTGTVSHQHIYGLLFRVLWPLAMQRPFARFTSDYIEPEGALTEHAICVVSSPTHLTRLLDSVSQPLALVFSSGAPLPKYASDRAAQLLDVDIIEVFGSTETGGIGWRRQHVGESSWRLFEAVSVRVNARGCLDIHSPFLSDDDWYCSADMGLLTESGFELIGRADRIVKVEGKRISLEQIEKVLLTHAWVEDVRVQPVVRASGAVQRDELVVLLVLSASGRHFLSTQGRSETARHLTDQLVGHLERPLLPRRWRYLDQLPRNNQGKLLLSELDKLLQDQTVTAGREELLQ